MERDLSEQRSCRVRQVSCGAAAQARHPATAERQLKRLACTAAVLRKVLRL